MSSKGDLDKVRSQIDEIDDRILKDLLERTKLVEKASRIKKKKGLEPYQPDRFAKILDRLEEKTRELGADPVLVRRVWYAIHSHSVEQQGGSVHDIVNDEFHPL